MGQVLLNSPFFFIETDLSMKEAPACILDLVHKDLKQHLQKWLDCRHPIKGILVSVLDKIHLSHIYQETYDLIINYQEYSKITEVNKVLAGLNNRLKNGGLLVFGISLKAPCDFSTPRADGILDSNNFSFKSAVKDFVRRNFVKKDYKYSPIETLGRIYACGFEYLDEVEVEGNYFLICRKKQFPGVVPLSDRGWLIRLNRIGENGRFIKIFKLRTMYPYSEYLQEFVYEKNKLKSSGKFNDDYRVTPLGRFLRKYWIDEIPMLWNWVRGDIKLIGVRPVSFHYFSLYPKELRDLRIKSKPGLLPPYYADIPKNFDEIVQSEMMYLTNYEKSPFITDMRYFFRIMINILFKRPFSS
jgi:lipopolysaccharide/colanic/teichoic acid biosynthesis glycosyltransferase